NHLQLCFPLIVGFHPDIIAFTLTATVEDKNGNPVPGSLVTFNLPRGVKPLTGDNVWVKANDEGKAELQVVSVTAGTYEITASAGNDQPSNAQSVTFVWLCRPPAHSCQSPQYWRWLP
ncbi:Ig-like domain-containing protein, partial [Bacillus sp. HC-Mk]